VRFFSVLDIIYYRQELMGHSIIQLYSFFKDFGIRKSDLLTFKESGVLPTEERLLNAILSYLDMSKVELELRLGRIPTGYEQVFLSNAKQIAELLEKEKENKNVNVERSAITYEQYFSTQKGKLFNGDCLALFHTIADNSVDCIFADPPFNLDKQYDTIVDDNKRYSEYISWCMDWLEQCVRVLAPGGSLFVYNIPKWHTYVSNYLNEKLKFWDWITVDMKCSLPIANRLYPAHYSLLYYVKGSKPKTFNSQRIPLQTCRHCGGELKDYGGYKDKMNPNGVNVSDVWSDIYPVRHKSSKTRKFNELSVKLLDRVISMSTNENDLVLDPFGGSGTTYAVSELLDRRWVGFEIGNCEVIQQRLMNLDNDKHLLEKIYEEKNYLFPLKIKKLRKTNGFWLDTDFDRGLNNQVEMPSK
jgi:site-specific DNA-methyltransferase (adenine-specific)